jgi:excinuclease ABC subunit B
VSCIYNIGSPKEYGNFVLQLALRQKFDINTVSYQLVQLQYDRSEFEFKRGTFRIRGSYFDVYPAYEDFAFRIYFEDSSVAKIEKIEPLTGKVISVETIIIVYPAKHFLADPDIINSAIANIRQDLHVEHDMLKRQNKAVEADRLVRRVNYDLEMIKEVGYVNGIENYSRYFDGRAPGDPPYSLLNYFKEAYGDDFLVFIDESHMTVPQIKGMFNGDYSRKKILTDFGFRLRAAFDNRPLKFEEFYKIPSKIIYVSATPDRWEMERSTVVEQLIRPTGIVDPDIIVRPSKNEVADLVSEIEKRVVKGEKILVTTLTKRIAEDLSEFLKEKKIRAEYLHSDIKTLERSNVLDNLRKNQFDVLIGINLLREGLDLPEVSLVAILDADKEGFLRSKTALIQTMGRAARNVAGEVIIYADKITKSIKEATEEIERRRRYQQLYNMKHHIKPKTINKPIREKIVESDEISKYVEKKGLKVGYKYLEEINVESMTPYDKTKIIKKLEREMREQAHSLNFELAIRIRDKIKDLKN